MATKKSDYRGVYHVKGKTDGEKQWRALVTFEKKTHFAGDYYTEREAALAYDELAYKLKGPKAKLNGINSDNVTKSPDLIKIQKKCPYIGVTWSEQKNKWFAYIRVNGKFKSLGLFDNAKEAAIVRDKAAVQFHGSKARLNNIDS